MNVDWWHARLYQSLQKHRPDFWPLIRTAVRNRKQPNNQTVSAALLHPKCKLTLKPWQYDIFSAFSLNIVWFYLLLPAPLTRDKLKTVVVLKKFGWSADKKMWTNTLFIAVWLLYQCAYNRLVNDKPSRHFCDHLSRNLRGEQLWVLTVNSKSNIYFNREVTHLFKGFSPSLNRFSSRT